MHRREFKRGCREASCQGAGRRKMAFPYPSAWRDRVVVLLVLGLAMLTTCRAGVASDGRGMHGGRRVIAVGAIAFRGSYSDPFLHFQHHDVEKADPGSGLNCVALRKAQSFLKTRSADGCHPGRRFVADTCLSIDRCRAEKRRIDPAARRPGVLAQAACRLATNAIALVGVPAAAG